MFVVSVYRPPKGDMAMSDFVASLQSILDDTPLSSRCSLCLVGDFNAKSRVWWDGQVTNDAGAQLERFASINGLSQVIEGPTRLVDGGCHTQLDLVFVSAATLVQDSEGLSAVADHCPTVVDFLFKRLKQSSCSKTWLDFDATDMSALNEHFISTVFHPFIY